MKIKGGKNHGKRDYEIKRWITIRKSAISALNIIVKKIMTWFTKEKKWREILRGLLIKNIYLDLNHTLLKRYVSFFFTNPHFELQFSIPCSHFLILICQLFWRFHHSYQLSIKQFHEWKDQWMKKLKLCLKQYCSKNMFCFKFKKSTSHIPADK